MDMDFQSVFSTAVEDERNFDTMFGSEEDEELMGIVLGESDDEADMDTLDTGIGAEELKDEVEGDESEKPPVDSNGQFDIENDAEKPGENIDCDKSGVADANDSNEPDEENIECGEFDDAEKASGIDELDEYANMLFSENAPETDDDAAPASVTPSTEACEGGAGNDDATAAQDEIPGEENVDTSDEGELDDANEAFEGFGLEDSLFTESDDEEEDEDEDGEEEEEESAVVDIDEYANSLFSEADEETTEGDEDAIIDTVEDDVEMSDAEADSYENIEDDDIIDSILGDE